MTSTDYSKLIEGIEKTGFPLEYRTAHTLKTAGWTVISGKYYIDDTHQVPREIDLIAYKVSKVGHLDVCTTLIVSCKKSENGAWALLARPLDEKDPNMDFWPLHLSSNDKAIQFEINDREQKKRYHADALKKGVQEALRMPGADVFAFQDMNLTSGAAKNDKPIFDAITSLVQAQAYELGALPARKKNPFVYQFNLISVSQADLVRFDFNGDAITPTPLASEHYIARYIIQRQETFARVHFVKAEAFVHILSDYNRLHEANCYLIKERDQEFFASAITDRKRLDIYLADFRKALTHTLNWRVSSDLKLSKDFKNMDLEWDSKAKQVHIELDVGFDEEIIEFLNADKLAKTAAAKVLKRLYRYSGPFSFVEDTFPF
jgi:hypothetical protein